MSPPAWHGWVDAASLYALPPEDYIASGDEAPDAARAAGDPAAATALKALRRPDPTRAEAVRSGRLVRAPPYAGLGPVERAGAVAQVPGRATGEGTHR